MVEIDHYDSRVEPGGEPGEQILELWDGLTLAVRVRYWPEVPEARGREFTVDPAYQAAGLGKQVIISLLEELRAKGAQTFRVCQPISTAPFVAYGCALDDGDAIVDLTNNNTLRLLKHSLMSSQTAY